MTSSDHVFQQAQRAHEEPDDDQPGPLGDKPLGYCPWCNAPLSREKRVVPVGLEMVCENCDGWDWGDTESGNRASYAREIEANAKLEAQVIRGSRKNRKEEW